MTATPTLRSSTAWSATANLIATCSRLGCTVWLAHALPTADNGDVIFVLWIAASALLVCGVGLATSLQRFISEGRSRDGQEPAAGALAATVGRWLMCSLLLGGALLAIALAALPHRAPGPWWLPSVLLLVLGLEGLGSAVLSGRLRFARMAQLALLGVVVQITGVAIGLHAGGIAGAALGYSAGSLPLACCGLLAVVGPTGGGDPARLRALARFAASIWFTGMASAFAWTRMELYLIGHYYDAHQLALYGVGLTWATLVSQPLVLLLGALTPHFASQIGSNQTSAAFRTYRQATTFLAVILMPACLGAAALTPVLLPLIFGAGYREAVPCAAVLVASGVWLTASVGSSLFYALAQSRMMVVTSIIGAILALAVGMAVVPAGGIMGAAWARFGTQGLMVAISAWCLHRLIGCPVPITALASTACSAALCAFGLSGALAAWGWLGALLAVPLLGAAYVAMIRALGVFGPEDYTLVRSVLASMRLLPTPAVQEAHPSPSLDREQQ